ncbi:MAG: bifunctional homocysteine S-methyltransferase/methylenetetrahydrofolate reductase [Clostridium sp.]|nr:bifunctional homocysteine S-methyltransferase/methylenetetrahydrofolate reductase [Clostridium sp.]
MSILKSYDYVLFDGAFGTYYSKKYHSEQPCEFACIEYPERVLEIHQEYIAAGAMAIKTNTFAANTISLKKDFSSVSEIITQAWKLANQAIGSKKVFVFADIGPIFTEDNSIDELYQIVDLFLSLGAKYFLLETAQDDSVFHLAGYIKQKLPDAFVITSFAVDQDGYTRKGIPLKKLVTQSKNWNMDAFGLNCMCGPSHLLQIISELSVSKPLSVMPNSGYPLSVNGRTLFIDNETYFADKMVQMYQQGVKILGGCCGTTPNHIKAVAQYLQNPNISAEMPRITIKEELLKEEGVTNPFAEKLNHNQKVIAVELDPPFDTDYSHIQEAAPVLKEVGADAITIADSPLARARANSFMMAAKIQREVGIPTIPHFTCRDQNMIGLKSLLMGGNIENIHNVLVVTGDPVPADNRRDIKGVFSTNSYHLIEYIQTLNQDIFQSNPYFIGGALNVNSKRFEFELKRALKKQEMGVRFFLTQPIYSEDAIENLKLAKQTLSVKILAGFMPIVSYRNAVFLNNEVAGIDIPEKVIARMEGQTSEFVQKISLDYCMDLILKIGHDCDGYYLMTPLKKYQMIAELIKRMK